MLLITAFWIEYYKENFQETVCSCKVYDTLWLLENLTILIAKAQLNSWKNTLTLFCTFNNICVKLCTTLLAEDLQL